MLARRTIPHESQNTQPAMTVVRSAAIRRYALTIVNVRANTSLWGGSDGRRMRQYHPTIEITTPVALVADRTRVNLCDTRDAAQKLTSGRIDHVKRNRVTSAVFVTMWSRFVLRVAGSSGLLGQRRLVHSPIASQRSAEHRGSAAKRDSMKKSPSWTPTYKDPRFVSCIRLLCGAAACCGARRLALRPMP